MSVDKKTCNGVSSMSLLARLLAGGLLTVATTAAHALDVHNARSPEAPEGAALMAGYMELHHYGSDSVSVTGATSPQFEEVEIYRNVVGNDAAEMRAIEEIEVRAGQPVELVPRGKHLVLRGPAQDFSAGDRFTIDLETTEGSVEAEVRVVDAQMFDHDDAADHGY